MIDPLEALIEYTRRDADLVTLIGERVAGRHMYGDGWALGARGMTLRYDGGPSDLYTERQTLRVEGRFYGQGQADAGKVWARFHSLTRIAERVTVQTSTGTGLIYWVKPISAPSVLYDPDLRMDYFLQFFSVAVHEVAVA